MVVERRPSRSARYLPLLPLPLDPEDPAAVVVGPGSRCPPWSSMVEVVTPTGGTGAGSLDVETVTSVEVGGVSPRVVRAAFDAIDGQSSDEESDGKEVDVDAGAMSCAASAISTSSTAAGVSGTGNQMSDLTKSFDFGGVSRLTVNPAARALSASIIQALARPMRDHHGPRPVERLVDATPNTS